MAMSSVCPFPATSALQGISHVVYCPINVCPPKQKHRGVEMCTSGCMHTGTHLQVCTPPGVSAQLLYHFRNTESLLHQGSRQVWTPLECYIWVFVCHSLRIAACLRAVCIYLFILLTLAMDVSNHPK